jgi:hypothetical protein
MQGAQNKAPRFNFKHQLTTNHLAFEMKLTLKGEGDAF